MPPKKQPKPKFRRGRVDRVKKGKKKASQKQIVNVTVTSTGSGSGGSSMGVPSQPIFMPNTYQQPLFTPAVDPIKNTLTEVLKEPVKGTEAVKSPEPAKQFSNPKRVFPDSASERDYDSGFAIPSLRRPAPSPPSSIPALTRVQAPRYNATGGLDPAGRFDANGNPYYAGRGPKSGEYKMWEASQKK